MHYDKKIPQKRAPELVSLSHEHHHALVFCVRLKKANLTTPEITQNYVRYFWENHISSHFENEEKYLLHLIPSELLKEQFLMEHNEIRLLINLILTASHEVFNNSLTLSEKLNQHIRFEERTMFPEIEKFATKKELQVLVLQLNKSVDCPVFFPEFWK